MPLTNDYSKLIVPLHPGFIPGKYYTSSGYYQSLTLTTLLTGTCYYTYFFIPFDTNFSSIALQINATSATEKARLAIYTIVNGLPAALVKDFGEIALNVSAGREFLNPTFLAAGWYAIATTTSASTVNFYAPNINLSSYIGLQNIAGSTYNGFSAALIYPASYPAIAPISAITNTISPLIWLKAA